MEFDLTEEQAFFVDTFAALPRGRVRHRGRARPGRRSRGLRPEGVGAVRGFGWTSLLVPEADGGGSFSEHGLLDLVLVAEEMGRVVAPGPLGPVNVVAGVLSRAGSREQKAEVLPGLLSGDRVAAWCRGAPGHRPVRRGRVRPLGDLLAGRGRGQADHLLVAVEHDGGLAHALVPRAPPAWW